MLAVNQLTKQRFSCIHTSYNIQIFNEVVGIPPAKGNAEGDYQSVQVCTICAACGIVVSLCLCLSPPCPPSPPYQNVPLKDKNGNVKEAYININGRVGYVLAPGQQYPRAIRAYILSVAVSSLEFDGVACSNVAVNAIRSDPNNDRSYTQYVVTHSPTHSDA